jgi:hypothetical protein
MEKTETAPALNQCQERRFSGTFRNFWVDIALFAVFTLEMNTTFTGIPIHEWLGLAACAVFVIHLLLHWQWIVSVACRFFGKLPAMQRLKYAVDVLLFVDMVVVMITGIWISKVAMSQIGVEFEQNALWRWLHSSSADWAVWLIGLHLAVNRRWVANVLKRYVWQPLDRFARASGVEYGGAK